MSQSLTSEDRHKHHLDPLTRGLPLWIIVAMGLGLWVGQLAPELGKALDWGIPLGLFLMIYPAMTKLHLGSIDRSAFDACHCLVEQAHGGEASVELM